VDFDLPIYRTFRHRIIASGVAAMLSTQLTGPPVAYAGEPGPPISQGSAQHFSGPAPELSAAALRVSRIAEQNGDHDFLIIDKVQGRIIAFEHGMPTFSGAALTGESLTDIIPQDAFAKSFSETRGLRYKVTPAGRFTVSLGYDPSYGATLDLNEVRGKDWDISIHKVWLGAPAEHRDVRLRTATGQDKHITYGCIDVDAETMRQLLRRVGHQTRMPLYILPVDERFNATLAVPHITATPVARPAVRMVSGTTGQ
jgi:hypothetical protein